eukprot:757011-Hanusia_phi.AAC.2
MARKSKKEILRKLFTGPLSSSFKKWKEHVQGAANGNEAKVIDPQWMERQFERLEHLLSSFSPSSQGQADPAAAKSMWEESTVEKLSRKVEEVQETVRSSLAKHEQDMTTISEQVSSILKIVERKTRKRSPDSFHRSSAAPKEGRTSLQVQEGQELDSPFLTSPVSTSTVSVARMSKRILSSCDNVMVNPSPSPSTIIPFRSSSRSPLREREGAEQWRKGINPSSSERRRGGGGGDFEYVRIPWYALPNLFDSISPNHQGKAFKSIRLLLCDDYHLFLRVREGEAREYLTVEMPEGERKDALSLAWKLDEQLGQVLSDNPGLRVDPAFYVDVSSRDGNEFGRYFQAT